MGLEKLETKGPPYSPPTGSDEEKRGPDPLAAGESDGQGEKRKEKKASFPKKALTKYFSRDL